MSFLAELKRRRVVRVAIVYGAVAFAVLQAADILVPALRLPEWTMTLVVLLLALGLPIALVVSWSFELTPEGLKRTADAPAAKDVASAAGSWLSVRSGLLAVALVGAGLVGGWFMRPAAAPALDDKSIAVLAI